MVSTDIKIKINTDEMELLNNIINAGLAKLTSEDKDNRPKMLVMRILKSLSVKFAKKLCEGRQTYAMKLSIIEADALVIAYIEAYIEANTADTWANLMLMRRCNQLHELTA